nr:MAG TPA: hypothetical protein [Caudoviricetes sp.]
MGLTKILHRQLGLAYANCYSQYLTPVSLS